MDTLSVCSARARALRLALPMPVSHACPNKAPGVLWMVRFTGQ